MSDPARQVLQVKAAHLMRIAWGVRAGRCVELSADSPVGLYEARAYVRRRLDEEHAQRVVSVPVARVARER